jgi:hypothetical protein
MKAVVTMSLSAATMSGLRALRGARNIPEAIAALAAGERQTQADHARRRRRKASRRATTSPLSIPPMLAGATIVIVEDVEALTGRRRGVREAAALKPLGSLSSLKLKLGIVIVAAVFITALTTVIAAIARATVAISRMERSRRARAAGRFRARARSPRPRPAGPASTAAR